MVDRLPYKPRENVEWDFSRVDEPRQDTKRGRSWDEILGPDGAERRRQSLVDKGYELNSRYQSSSANRWSESVHERDKRICQNCLLKIEDKRVSAHHIIPWEVDESLRFDPDNGLILCGRCHGKIHPGGRLPFEMRLWAYDPGGTTGYAEFVRTRFSTWEIRSWGELELWHGITDQIRFGDRIVYENIVPRSMSFNPIGLQIIGAIRLLAEMREVFQIWSQMNSSIHGIQKQRILDDLFSTIRSQHSKDAIAHGVVHLRREGFQVDLAHSDQL